MAIAYRGAEDTLRATLDGLQRRAGALGAGIDRERLDPAQATLVSTRWRAATESVFDLGSLEALERACSAYRDLVYAYEEVLARSVAPRPRWRAPWAEGAGGVQVLFVAVGMLLWMIGVVAWKPELSVLQSVCGAGAFFASFAMKRPQRVNVVLKVVGAVMMAAGAYLLWMGMGRGR